MSITPPLKTPMRFYSLPNDLCWCKSGLKYKRCHKESDSRELREERKRNEPHRVMPGKLSPKRTVPPHIAAPDYAQSGRPGKGSGKTLLNTEELQRLRKACQAAAEVLKITSQAIRPGITTDALDGIAHEAMLQRGGYPSTLNYRGFPKSICTSANEIICHGIPDSRPLQDGDILNIDVTIFLEGMHGDTNATFAVGNIDEKSQNLIRTTHEALWKGIGAVKPGLPLRVIGQAIQAYATAKGMGVVRDYCGHGIGDVFQTGLQIPHLDDPSATTLITPGMTFTIEPMITLGSPHAEHWNDGWTAVTEDLARTAQFEHTILVTEQGAEVLTLGPNNSAEDKPSV
ncbi:MAG: type I methionyl aminopeptidase [Cystobacterineae bacterium]|nr:type I methionyl aminopeptidase [Cystobacterineae bacterium]